MNALRLARLPLDAAAVLGKEKSFRKNPVIGSERLNKAGLHKRRVEWAYRLSERRRAALAPRLRPEERAAFDANGFMMRPNALPDELFARLREELATQPRPGWETRQGPAVTRMMPFPARDDGSAVSEARNFLRSADVRNLIGYCAGRTGHLLAMIQTIAVEPLTDGRDPQSMLHADTFHPTAKLWLFLHDVGVDEGPFSYVPGSHRLTPERLEWEYEQSVTAARQTDPHHSAGSFRLPEDQLSTLGYGPLERMPVAANTLVVADTYGFHCRTPSAHPTVRTELYGMVRRNPFVPWNGGDSLELPFLRERALWIYLNGQDRKARAGKRVVYTNVGDVLASEPGQLAAAAE